MRPFAAILLLLPLVAFASPAPSLPACTAAQHDAYRAPGPDGVRYPTWHPLIDLKAGCIFDHEHGSNPALFAPAAIYGANAQGAWPLFGYSAARMGMSEGHAGFKVYVFDDGSGHRWMLTQHQGTGNAALAACTRHHTLDAAVLDIASNAVLIMTYGMTDFGRAQSNEAGTPPLQTACADQSSIPTSAGARQFPMADAGNVGYEPWRASTACAAGFCPSAITFNAKNPQTACGDLTCAIALPRVASYGPQRGTWRELTVSAGFGVPGVATIDHGLFCQPVDALAYAYSCKAGAYDSGAELKNVFVTGAN